MRTYRQSPCSKSAYSGRSEHTVVFVKACRVKRRPRRHCEYFPHFSFITTAARSTRRRLILPKARRRAAADSFYRFHRATAQAPPGLASSVKQHSSRHGISTRVRLHLKAVRCLRKTRIAVRPFRKDSNFFYALLADFVGHAVALPL